jgi:hypothetical protein
MVNVLVLILSFLGLLGGVIVSYFTKEELKLGERYFLLLEKVLLLSISFTIIYYVGEFFLFLALGVLAGFIFRKAYFYFGLALPLASETFLLLLSSLVFVFGLPHGTLLASKSKIKVVKKELIISANLFLAAILITLFLDYSPLLMFVSGALIINSIDIKVWKLPLA